MTIVDAINDYDGGFRAVSGSNGTAGIFATYPQPFVSPLSAYLDQVCCALRNFK